MMEIDFIRLVSGLGNFSRIAKFTSQVGDSAILYSCKAILLARRELLPICHTRVPKSLHELTQRLTDRLFACCPNTQMIAEVSN